MLHPTRIVMVSLAVIGTLMLAVASASASRLSLTSNQFRVVWSPLTIEGSGIAVRCPVTMEGSFRSRTIQKVRESTIGSVTRASVGACTGGTATFLTAGLPWNFTYESFEGTLPNISGLKHNMPVFGLSVDPEGIPPACLIAGETRHPVLVAVAVVIVVGFLLYQVWRLVRAAFGRYTCGFTEIEFAGEGAVTVQGSTSRISIELI
jgi:hypothetical protein